MAEEWVIWFDCIVCNERQAGHPCRNCVRMHTCDFCGKQGGDVKEYRNPLSDWARFESFRALCPDCHNDALFAHWPQRITEVAYAQGSCGG